jgi:voltage-gated potassium channel Kch
LNVYYGDASCYDLLEMAGTGEARVLVLTLNSPEKTLQLVHTARTHVPHLTIIARTSEWPETYALYVAEIHHVYCEDLDTAVRSGVDMMRLIGV